MKKDILMKNFRVALLCVLALAVCCPAAMASNSSVDASEASCAKVGTVTLNCFRCKDNHPLGTVKIPAEYNENMNSCIIPTKGFHACAKLSSDVEFQQVGYAYSYTLGETQVFKAVKGADCQ